MEIRRSSCMRSVFAYGMIGTPSGFVQTDYSEDVYQLKKDPRLSKDVIHHPMEDTIECSRHIQRSSIVDFYDQPCMKTKEFIRICKACQKHGNINSRDAMSLTSNLQIELFDCRGIDYMGPFPNLGIMSIFSW